jgi:hypothetical protein
MARSGTYRPIRPAQTLRLATFVFMMLIALAAVALHLIGGGTRPVGQSESGLPGRLIASPATVDLGRVPFDTLAEARFELANTGTDTVKLVGAPKVRMLEGC